MTSNIPWIGIVIAASIPHIRAETSFTKYKVIRNKRAELNVTSVKENVGKTECSVRCAETEGCRKANWFANTCELLREPEGGVTLVDDDQSWFLYAVPSCLVTYDLISSDEYGIPDSALTASSEPDTIFSTARLNSSAMWSATIAVGQGIWIQAEFSENRFVTGIRTRGHTDFDGYVTRYTISTSRDVAEWQTIKLENGENLVFEGNTDTLSIVMNILPEPIITRFVRLNVVQFFGFIPTLRWAIDGCPVTV